MALFETNPAALPSVAVVNGGTVTVSDNATASLDPAYAPTLNFAQQAGGTPILSLVGGSGYGRTLTENWSMAPVNDADQLRRLRCAFQLLVLGGHSHPCDNCRTEIEKFFLADGQELACLIPRGWYCVGRKHDVPRQACYVGNYGETYVWVMPPGVDGLSRFSMTVLDLATGKPHASYRTIVRTYKGEPNAANLVTTEITSKEIDEQAMERIRRNRGLRPERQRSIDARGNYDRGLQFIPD